MTNDESQSELNTTYEKPAADAPVVVVSCNSFYSAPQPQEQPQPQQQAKGARIVRPTKQIETAVGDMFRAQRGESAVVVKKLVEVCGMKVFIFFWLFI